MEQWVPEEKELGGKSREGAGGGARGAGSSAISSPIGRSDGGKFGSRIFPHRHALNWCWWSNGSPEQKEPVASQEMEREEEQEEQVPPQFLHLWREKRWEEVREQDLPAQVRPQLELVERWVLEQKQPEVSQEMERGAA